MKLTWITGANGLIGNYLVQTAPRFAPHRRVCALTRDQLDLLDCDAVRREFQKDRPQLVIHCAAVSTIAAAQSNPDLARRVNVDATALLAGLAADIPFVFFSSDLVFDGRKGNYAEADAVNPLHLYGETKTAAEQIILRNPRHTVVRTSLNGGTSRAGNRGFNEQLRRSLQTSPGMKLFTDEFRCPIPAVETAAPAAEAAAELPRQHRRLRVAVRASWVLRRKNPTPEKRCSSLPQWPLQLCCAAVARSSPRQRHGLQEVSS